MCLLVIVSHFHKNGLQATNSNAKFYLITHPNSLTLFIYDDKPANSKTHLLAMMNFRLILSPLHLPVRAF